MHRRKSKFRYFQYCRFKLYDYISDSNRSTIIYPIIVIGPPRSGTSVIARILQENLNISMDRGHLNFIRNKKGDYEDYELTRINARRIERYLKTGFSGFDVKWFSEFSEYVHNMQSKYDKWGFKDPNMSLLLKYAFPVIPKATIIKCYRKEKQILESQIKNLGFSKQVAIEGIKSFYAHLEEALNNKKYHTIDLSIYKNESRITKELKEALWQ